jgi:hypothetical protein
VRKRKIWWEKGKTKKHSVLEANDAWCAIIGWHPATLGMRSVGNHIDMYHNQHSIQESPLLHQIGGLTPRATLTEPDHVPREPQVSYTPPKKRALAWFQDEESMLNHHLVLEEEATTNFVPATTVRRGMSQPISCCELQSTHQGMDQERGRQLRPCTWCIVVTSFPVFDWATVARW